MIIFNPIRVIRVAKAADSVFSDMPLPFPFSDYYLIRDSISDS
jgi:hypothetical protein